MDNGTITKLWMLMDIIHKAAQGGPKYAWLVAKADAAVQAMNVPEPSPIQPAPPPENPDLTAPEEPIDNG